MFGSPTEIELVITQTGMTTSDAFFRHTGIMFDLSIQDQRKFVLVRTTLEDHTSEWFIDMRKAAEVVVYPDDKELEFDSSKIGIVVPDLTQEEKSEYTVDMAAYVRKHFTNNLKWMLGREYWVLDERTRRYVCIQ